MRDSCEAYPGLSPRGLDVHVGNQGGSRDPVSQEGPRPGWGCKGIKSRFLVLQMGTGGMEGSHEAPDSHTGSQ